MVLSSWKGCRPSGPSSRPIPLALTPPNGAKGSLTYPLTPIVRVRTFLANEAPRAGSAVHPDPASPYSLSLAIATASRSSAYGITASTGPKLASCPIVALGSTPAKIVGSTNHPRSNPSGRLPPVVMRAPSALPLAIYDSTRSRCRSETSGPIFVAVSNGSPIVSDSARPVLVSTTASYLLHRARTRVHSQQICPLLSRVVPKNGSRLAV